MNLAISMQSLKNVFRFPFHDPKWQNKLLIGSLLGLGGTVIPLVPLLPLMGYLARVLRGGARNDAPAPLPEWDDWGDLFMDGLRMFGVSLLATLPAALIVFFGWIIYMIGTVQMSTTRNSMDANNAVLPFLISLGIFFLSMAVGTVLGLVGLVTMLPATAHVAVQRRFSALFEFGKWWSILRANFLGFLVALALSGALYMLIMFAVQILYMTLIFCLLIPFVLMPISFYAGIILYRMIGQAYGESVQQEVAVQPAVAEMQQEVAVQPAVAEAQQEVAVQPAVAEVQQEVAAQSSAAPQPPAEPPVL